MSDSKTTHDNQTESTTAAAGQQTATAITTAVGVPNPYSMDPNAVYRQQLSEPGTMGEDIQQSHYLPMEPPVGSQPVLGYNVSYVPSQVGGDAASIYGYTSQVPMQPIMQSGDPSASFPNVSVASSSSQGRDKPAKRRQVKNACVNCQKACKKCDDGRPCQRCVKYNLTETCVNSPRKERKKGIKRGPYKRRQKVDHDSDAGHGAQITGNENETSFATGDLMGNIPGVGGIPGQHLPPQGISYYQAYYPTQQPVIYDPNQLSQGQPSSYYYMSAQPPPSHPSHQLHTGAIGGEQQQQPQQISIISQQAPPSHYYYPQYYQAPPLPPPQMAQGSQYPHAFPSGAITMHTPGQTSNITTNQSVSPSETQLPHAAQQNNNGSHSFSFPGGFQHTAAVMIAPVIALSPTIVYKRRDSKIDILSELCTAVLDRDKQRDCLGDDSDVSVADDHDEGMDWIPSQYKSTKLASFNDDKSLLLLNDQYKSIHNEEKVGFLWNRHTTPPPSPKLEYYRRASSVDSVCDKEHSNTRSSSQLSFDKSITTTITSPILSSHYNNSNGNHGYYRHRHRYRCCRPSALPILNSLSVFDIMTPEHSPTEASFPEFSTSMDESTSVLVQNGHFNSLNTAVTDTVTDCDHISLLPSNWLSLLPTPDCYGALSESDKVLDALLPQRRRSQSDMTMMTMLQNGTSKQDLSCVTTTATTTVMAGSEPVAVSNNNAIQLDDKEKKSKELSILDMDITSSNDESSDHDDSMSFHIYDDDNNDNDSVDLINIESNNDVRAVDYHDHLTESLLNSSSTDDKSC